jgi:hypothetical protein
MTYNRMTGPNSTAAAHVSVSATTDGEDGFGKSNVYHLFHVLQMHLWGGELRSGV